MRIRSRERKEKEKKKKKRRGWSRPQVSARILDDMMELGRKKKKKKKKNTKAFPGPRPLISKKGEGRKEKKKRGGPFVSYIAGRRIKKKKEGK